VQLLAKLARQAIEHPRHFFSDLVMIHSI
jgi:hypothetical protein